MSITAWIFCYIAQALWWLWLARWGGAHTVEGWRAAFLLHPIASGWNTDGIKLFAWASLVASTFWFVLGLFEPAARLM